MNVYKRIIVMLAGGALFTLVFADNAYAYLDPGTLGSMFQMLVAALVGSLLAIRLFWHQLRSFVRNLFVKGDDRDEAYGERSEVTQ